MSGSAKASIIDAAHQKNLFRKEIEIMAAVKTLKSSRASLKLNAGQTAAGKDITKTISLPALVANASADDIIAVKNAASPCLAYPVASIEHAVTNIITEE